MTALNAAERYAALRLLSEGVAAALKTAQAEADEYRKAVRAKSLETDFGSVSVTRRKPSIRFDEAALVAWCEDEYPEMVQRIATIPAAHRSWLTDQRLTIEGDDVLDVTTGEVVPWAHVSPGSDVLTFRADPTAKAAAIASVTERIELLAATLTPALTEES